MIGTFIFCLAAALAVGNLTVRTIAFFTGRADNAFIVVALLTRTAGVGVVIAAFAARTFRSAAGDFPARTTAAAAIRCSVANTGIARCIARFAKRFDIPFGLCRTGRTRRSQIFVVIGAVPRRDTSFGRAGYARSVAANFARQSGRIAFAAGRRVGRIDFGTGLLHT